MKNLTLPADEQAENGQDSQDSVASSKIAFIEAARALGVGEAGKGFGDLVSKILAETGDGEDAPA